MLNSKTNNCYILLVCLLAIKVVYLKENPGNNNKKLILFKILSKINLSMNILKTTQTIHVFDHATGRLKL